MTKEKKFFEALQNVFIGAKVEGDSGFINLMRIKSGYYAQIEKILQKDIEDKLKGHTSFREELFVKLYDFFHRYFTESGSIYFNSTPFHNNIYERVYTDEKTIQKFSVTRDDLDLAKRYFGYLGDRVTLVKHDCEPRILEKVQDSFEKEESFYNLDYDQSYYKPDLIFDRIINHYSLRQKEFDRFKALQEEIVHFKRIKYTGEDQLAEFLEKIRQVKRYGEKAEKEKQLELQFDKDGDHFLGIK